MPKYISIKQSAGPFLIGIISLAFAWVYASIFLRYTSIDEWQRPYILRAFVPLAARLLTWVMDERIAIVAVLILCVLGLLWSLYYLYGSFYVLDRRADLFALFNISVLFVILSEPRYRQKYDLATALFFTLGIALLDRRRFTAYLLMFPFACVNRETAILLTFLFGVYFWNKLQWWDYTANILIQVIIFIAIRLAVMRAYADAPGIPFMFRPIENLQMLWDAPFLTALYLIGLAVLGFVIFRSWGFTPPIIQTTFMIFAPILSVLYFLFGQMFEIRVFIEILPALSVILVSRIGIYHDESSR